jgi:uncharacterized metal-binding protein YceD (DUF177 family)
LHPFCEKVNKVISTFDINIHGLENKQYEYHFEGNNSFFEAFEQDYLNQGDFKVNIILDKSVSLIRVHFDIVAEIQMQCDRSLEDFVETFQIKEDYIFKFGEKAEVVNEELEIIPFGATKINIAQLIFDFISLQIPMKKLHPRFRNEDDDNSEGILVYSDALEDKKEEVNDGIDPRWAELLKLKNLKK